MRVFFRGAWYEAEEYLSGQGSIFWIPALNCYALEAEISKKGAEAVGPDSGLGVSLAPMDGIPEEFREPAAGGDNSEALPELQKQPGKTKPRR
jgi:hypothetical protein